MLGEGLGFGAFVYMVGGGFAFFWASLLLTLSPGAVSALWVHYFDL